MPLLSIRAYTGHRPDKLGGYQIPNPTYTKICATIKSGLLVQRPDLVISGMALGIDTWVAQACVELNVPFVAAIPFVGQDGRWPLPSRNEYAKLLKLAQAVKVVGGDEDNFAKRMQNRNEWMVDNSTELHGYWNGSTGGTANCVRYAKLIGRTTIIVNPDKLLKEFNETTWYSADVPHFCCGFGVTDGIITESAPIMAWAIGKTLGEFSSWCITKKGKVSPI
jgi:uncharacterized phage-like protein YoqJ